MLSRRLSPLIFLAFVSIFGALNYYAARISQISLFIVFVASIVGTYLAQPFDLKDGWQCVTRFFVGWLKRITDGLQMRSLVSSSVGRSRSIVGLGVSPTITTAQTNANSETYERDWSTPLFIVALSSWWLIITQTSIVESVRSLWGIVPVAALTLLAAAVFFARHVKREALAIAALVFSGVTLAAVVFPLGYGFDPFLHRAAIAHIAEFGTLLPKTPYYMGAYALELFFGQPFLGLTPKLVDIFLTSGLLALVVATFAPLLKQRDVSPWILLLLPLGAFVTTTPQSIAFVFLLATAFAAYTLTGNDRRIITSILALATLLAHPLAGFFALALAVGSYFEKWPKLSAALVFLLSAGLLPASFIFLGWQANHAWPEFEFSLTQLASLPVPWSFISAGRPALDLLYLLGSLSALLIPMLAVLALWQRRRALSATDGMLVATALGAIVAIVVMTALPMKDLISYEQLDYAGRLLTVGLLVLLPIAGTVTCKRGATLATLLLPLLFIGNVYLAYPRNDGYVRAAGFNVSAGDFAVAQVIETDAALTPYAVLSDQALAAAAVQTFGFKTYFHDTIFFYPIPTGGPLYGLYLDMVNDAPKLSTIEKARQLTGAPLIYFVVHDYWWDSARLNAEAAAIATKTINPAPGIQVHVFESPLQKPVAN